MRTRGMTVVEILIVVGIAAVLGGLGIPSLLQSSRVSDIKQLQNQIAADFLLARDQAIRTSNDAKFIINSDLKSYKLEWTANAETQTRDRGVDSKYEIGFANSDNATATTGTLIYTSPDAELKDANNLALRIRRVDNAVKPLYIKIIGVTGKVIKSDQPAS